MFSKKRDFPAFTAEDLKSRREKLLKQDHDVSLFKKKN